MQITELLAFTKKNNASDLHISSNHPPVMRIHGDMLPLKMPKLTPDQVKERIYAVMTEQQRSDYENDLELDFSVQFGDDLRFRANAFNTIHGPAIAFRYIETDIRTLEQLNMPEVLKRFTTLHKGLVLVTGPTGSGKSTTLAAMINEINENQSKHILTIEDPVEYVHKSKKCLINQRELGSNTVSFARALKSALREDPDVILVGELRDLETIQLALTAAETGHVVFGTLHTNSAAKTIDRIIDAFPAQDKSLIMSMLASSIEGVVAQTLLKKADNAGRVAALEVLIATPAIRNMIREHKTPQIYSLMQVGRSMGMRTMKDSIYAMLEKGLISETVARDALNINEEKEDALPQAGANNNGAGEQRRAAAAPRAVTNSEDF